MATINHCLVNDVCLRCNGKGTYKMSLENFANEEIVECEFCKGDGKLHREQYTCDKCSANGNCDCAWSVYNIGGDCLAEK